MITHCQILKIWCIALTDLEARDAIGVWSQIAAELTIRDVDRDRRRGHESLWGGLNVDTSSLQAGVVGERAALNGEISIDVLNQAAKVGCETPTAVAIEYASADRSRGDVVGDFHKTAVRKAAGPFVVAERGIFKCECSRFAVQGGTFK